MCGSRSANDTGGLAGEFDTATARQRSSGGIARNETEKEGEGGRGQLHTAEHLKKKSTACVSSRLILMHSL